jgi:hypothetical protein
MSERRNQVRRRGRHPRNRPHNSNSNHPWYQQVHQTKLTIRNLVSESISEILMMIASMVTQLNTNLQSTGNSNVNATDSSPAKRLPIHLDIGSFERVLKEEVVMAEDGSLTSANTSEVEDSDAHKKDGKDIKIDSDINKTLSKLMENRPLSNGAFLTLRVLYVVPAKVSRRRGKIHGCAYVLLTVPPPSLVDTHSPLTDKLRILSPNGECKVEEINSVNSASQEKSSQFRPTAAERTRYVSWARHGMICLKTMPDPVLHDGMARVKFPPLLAVRFGGMTKYLGTVVKER